MNEKAIWWAFTAPTNDPYELLLLITLARYAKEDLTCSVSINTLSEKSYMSARTVSRKLKSLEEFGVIKRMPQFYPEGGRAEDLYIFQKNAFHNC